MQPAVEASELSKSFRVTRGRNGRLSAIRDLLAPNYQEVAAVRAVSFRIDPGERVAFIGPNGAGKSTTIKMLTGILEPTRGCARVAGLVPCADRTRLAQRIGVVFGQRSQLWYHLPAVDSLELLARIYGLDPAAYRVRKAALTEQLDVGPLLSRPVRQLSLGERMRVEVMASLLHEPQLLFLDEPTIGLDVVAKSALRDHVRRLSVEDGCSVLLTSHDTADMEEVCDRVIVIHRGRLLIDAPVRRLRSDFIRAKVITLRTREPQPIWQLPGTSVVDRGPNWLRIEVDLKRTPVERALRHALDTTGIHDLTVEDPPMDQVIREVYRRAEIPK